MWTGPWIGVGFERKLLLLSEYFLCPIDLDLTFDSYDPDKPYAEVIV